MALIFNIEEDEFYQEGARKEREKANLEIEKANLEKKQSVINAYKSGIDIKLIANIFSVSIEYVKEIIKNS